MTQAMTKKSNFDINSFLLEANKYDKHIVESLGIKYNKSGIQCPCPVHNGDNPMGFSYCPIRKIWSCWTHGCHDKYCNNLIGLVRGIRKCSFKDSINYIKNIMNSPDSIPSESIIEEEYIDVIFNDDVVKQQNNNVDIWLNSGFSQEILNRFSVFECHTRGKPMYGRIIVPFRNIDNQIVAFMGYKTDKIISTMKWKFLPKGFKKSRHLFGLNFYPDNKKSVFIVEGAKDVLRMHQAGFTNSVCICGVYLSTKQIKLLKSKNISTINLCLDPNNAGQTGAEKIIKRLSILFSKVNNIVLPNDPGKLSVSELQQRLSSYDE